MDADVVEMKVTLARVLERLDNVTDKLTEQDKILERQGQRIADLISMADQGKGSVWMLITVGGFIGAVISNAKPILQFFVK